MPSRRRFDLRKLGLSVVVAAAFGLIIWGFASAQTGDSAVEITDTEAIERVIPNPGSLVLRQSQIGVDLQSGWRGILIIDGQEVPTADLTATGAGVGADTGFDAQFDPAQNTVLFAPRVGATIEQFDAGTHRVTAVYWKIAESRDRARSFSWSFKVS